MASTAEVEEASEPKLGAAPCLRCAGGARAAAARGHVASRPPLAAPRGAARPPQRLRQSAGFARRAADATRVTLPGAPGCARPRRCSGPSTLQCPTCLKQGLARAPYCSQECFKARMAAGAGASLTGPRSRRRGRRSRRPLGRAAAALCRPTPPRPRRPSPPKPPGGLAGAQAVPQGRRRRGGRRRLGVLHQAGPRALGVDAAVCLLRGPAAFQDRAAAAGARGRGRVCVVRACCACVGGAVCALVRALACTRVCVFEDSGRGDWRRRRPPPKKPPFPAAPRARAGAAAHSAAGLFRERRADVGDREPAAAQRCVCVCGGGGEQIHDARGGRGQPLPRTTRTRIHTHARTHARTRTHTHTHTHTHTRTPPTNTHTHTHNTRAHTHTRTHAHTHTSHTHTHTRNTTPIYPRPAQSRSARRRSLRASAAPAAWGARSWTRRTGRCGRASPPTRSTAWWAAGRCAKRRLVQETRAVCAKRRSPCGVWCAVAPPTPLHTNRRPPPLHAGRQQTAANRRRPPAGPRRAGRGGVLPLAPQLLQLPQERVHLRQRGARGWRSSGCCCCCWRGRSNGWPASVNEAGAPRGPSRPASPGARNAKTQTRIPKPHT
jgi:hypothetical protein